MNSLSLRRFIARNSALFALVLFVIALLINYFFQSNLFEARVINSNLRNLFPLMLLAVGQTIVIIGGGIDLSVGAMVTMINALIVMFVTPESPAGDVVLTALLVCLVGMAAGALNGFLVAYLRLQPIVTTYATSFIFAGLAQHWLPRPGGAIPGDLARTMRSAPLDIPFVVFLIVIVALAWLLLRSTRFGQFVYATGSNSPAAYATGVPVNRVRFGTYVLAGLFAAISGIALTINLGSGALRVGEDMTLSSIVAVVLGGTALSGGQGGAIGTIIGVLILGIIRNIIAFANVPTWSQVLVDALIIIAALTGPGLIRLVRRSFHAR